MRHAPWSTWLPRVKSGRPRTACEFSKGGRFYIRGLAFQYVNPGRSSRYVTATLDTRAFSTWSTDSKRWVAVPGSEERRCRFFLSDAGIPAWSGFSQGLRGADLLGRFLVFALALWSGCEMRSETREVLKAVVTKRRAQAEKSYRD